MHLEWRLSNFAMEYYVSSNEIPIFSQKKETEEKR